MKRSVILLPGILAATLAVTPATAVTLGASVQLTGPIANTGRYYRDGYEFAIDKINAAGRRQGRRQVRTSSRSRCSTTSRT